MRKACWAKSAGDFDRGACWLGAAAALSIMKLFEEANDVKCWIAVGKADAGRTASSLVTLSFPDTSAAAAERADEVPLDQSVLGSQGVDGADEDSALILHVPQGEFIVLCSLCGQAVKDLFQERSCIWTADVSVVRVQDHQDLKVCLDQLGVQGFVVGEH
mmetsp:Transcript_7141/g.14319  ORF Transcript_7141/g.14319 Transcript_7141/m.14319 type:complete len:160 (+) Transcript_7141:175-654(+)